MSRLDIEVHALEEMQWLNSDWASLEDEVSYYILVEQQMRVVGLMLSKRM